MSKKRKQSHQSTTLLTFFRQDLEVKSISSKTERSAGSQPPQKPLAKYEPQLQAVWTSQEVIVIESDDEVEAQVLSQTATSPTAGTRSSSKACARETKVEEKHARKRSRSQSFKDTSASRDENIFVEGGTWMGARHKTKERYPSSTTHVDDCNLDELRQSFYADTPSPELVPIPRPSNLEECPSFDLREDELQFSASDLPPDDWNVEVDFDSQVPQALLDDCEDVLMGLVSKVEEEDEPRDAEHFDTCPICNTTFLDSNEQDVQDHVNNCLDAKPKSSNMNSPGEAKPMSATQKILRPISYLFTQPPKAKSAASGLPPGNANAFSRLMSSHDENAAWEEAQAHEDRSFKPTKSNRRKAPFYKVLTGMPIAVDAFRYGAVPGIAAYFLTHAHSDHYTNLSSNWDHGLIYCSDTTANLVAKMLSVDRKWLKPLPMDVPTEIPNTGGVKVTLIDANHCPGSCLFLFEGRQTANAGDSTYKSNFVGSERTFRYLHCGDFRACPRQVLHPALRGRRLDAVYLDTTYLNPRYCFPPQPLVSAACAELARRIVKGESVEEDDAGMKGSIQSWVKVEESTDVGKGKRKNGDVLIVVGTYSIGKERIVKAIAKALDTKIYCDSRKAALLRCQDDPQLHALLTTDPLVAGVHVVPLGQVASDRFKEYIARWPGRWARAVAFRPTGWTYSPPAGSDPMPAVASVIARTQARGFTHKDLKPGRNSTRELVTYGVPYSEHSSFAELACFALSVDCGRVIATVNVGSAPARARMQKWVERWEAERKKRKERGEAGVVKYRSLDYW